MGACCDCFQKEEIHTNESRMRLLQSKVQALYHTENDHHFTYYLHYFEQHIYLERVLREYRQVVQRTEDSSAYLFDSKQMEIQLQTLDKYLKDIQDKQSKVSSTMSSDISRMEQTNKKEIQFDSNKDICMIKLQIQGFELIQGITRIGIVKSIKVGNEQKKTEEYIIVNRIKHQKVYRQLIFSQIKGSKIKIITQPTASTISIDVEDIMKSQAVCDVFKFQNKDEDFGFVALRLQFASKDKEFNDNRFERLKVLEKQLKMCVQTKDGVHRLSSSRSDASSLKNTFVSDYVSQYNNQYHL